MRPRFLETTLYAFLIGCSVTGVGDYEVDECAPAASQAEDACARLDPSDTCHPYQCDPTLKRCVRKVRDDDRDGDPPIGCGGHDCDDKDGTISSLGHEVCDGKPNICGGSVDQGLIKPGTPAELVRAGSLEGAARQDIGILSASGKDSVASYVVTEGATTGDGGASSKLSCVQIARLASPAATIGTECAVLRDDKTLGPRHPAARLLDNGGFGAVVVTTKDCPNGALAYRYVAPGGGSESEAASGRFNCNDHANGAALPTFAPFPAALGGLVAWYDVALADRDTPETDCVGIKPGQLQVAFVDNPASQQPTIDTRKQIALAADTYSLERPATVSPDGFDGLLVASSVKSTVAVWTVVANRGTKLIEATATTTLPDVTGARGVALGARKDGNLTRLMLVAAIGCGAQQAARFAAGTFDPATKSVVFEPAHDLSTAGGGAMRSPQVAWVEGRGEWLVTWLGESGAPRGARIGKNATGPGDNLELPGSSAVAPAASGTIYVLGGETSRPTFNEVPLGCTP